MDTQRRGEREDGDPRGPHNERLLWLLWVKRSRSRLMQLILRWHCQTYVFEGYIFSLEENLWNLHCDVCETEVHCRHQECWYAKMREIEKEKVIKHNSLTISGLSSSFARHLRVSIFRSDSTQSSRPSAPCYDSHLGFEPSACWDEQRSNRERWMRRWFWKTSMVSTFCLRKCHATSMFSDSRRKSSNIKMHWAISVLYVQMYTNVIHSGPFHTMFPIFLPKKSHFRVWPPGSSCSCLIELKALLRLFILSLGAAAESDGEEPQQTHRGFADKRTKSQFRWPLETMQILRHDP